MTMSPEYSDPSSQVTRTDVEVCDKDTTVLFVRMRVDASGRWPWRSRIKRMRSNSMKGCPWLPPNVSTRTCVPLQRLLLLQPGEQVRLQNGFAVSPEPDAAL